MSLGVWFGVASAVSAQGVSTGYTSERTLPFGMIVNVDPGNERAVVPASQTDMQHLFGVVVNGSDSLLSISGREDNVQVATEGVVEVLVSDLDGPIANGDPISVSVVDGIGSKAVRQPRLFGVAKADFAGEDQASVERTEVLDVDGQERSVALGRIPVQIQIGTNAAARGEESFLPEFIQESANAVAGKPVAPIRVVISLIILLASLIGTTVLLYGAVSSAIISIGRNPLSNKSVYRGLVKVLLLTMLLIGVSCVVAYVILSG